MSEWTNISLADVAEIRFSNVDKKTNPGESLVRLCNYMDVYGNGGYITADLPFMEASASRAEVERFRVETGDVIVTKDSETPDDIGIPAVVVDEIPNLICGYHLALIKPNREKINPVYLAKQLASNPTVRYFSNLANGSTRYGLSSSSIASTPIPLAPLSQQRRIAEILSTVDEAIEQTEALIAKYQQIKAGLMHDLFTRGVTPDGQLRPPQSEAPHLYQQSPLGWIPKEWEVKRLGLLAEIVSGVTLGSKREISDQVGVPYLRVANVQDGYFDLDDVKTIQVSRAQFEKLALKHGDVLMNEGGDFDKLGRGSVWLEQIKPCIHQNHVFRVRPRDGKLRSFYLAFWSQSEEGRKYFIVSSKQSTNLASINSTQLNRFPIALPSLNEQSQIEKRIQGLNGYGDSLQTNLTKLRQQKHGLMHDLLTGRVCVTEKEEN